MICITDTLLPDANTPPLTIRILPVLIQILTTYQKDPTTLVNLALKLLKPVSFTQALMLASEDSLVQALRSPSPSTNILAISVLEKAARSPGDTAILSIMREVVESFLRTWLSTPHVEVGEKAAKTLGDLLSMDCDLRSSAELDSKMHGLQITSRTPPGQGLLWRRIFHDREIYGALLELCSFKTVGSGDGQLNERQKPLAQARLLRVLPRMAALDFPTVSRTNFPDIERQYEIHEGEQGLLWFAATDMVNKSEDMLMHITVIDFFAELLEVMSLTEITPRTMEYLARLLKKVTATDSTMYKSLESIVLNPESPPELVDLLVRLNQYQ
jgi:DNA mismatch repair protein HSM3, N terminal domain